MDAPTPPTDPLNTPSKGFWATIVEAVGNPFTYITTWSKKSPFITLLAVVFLVQPLVTNGIDLFQEWHSARIAMDPSKRPITKSELDLVNAKVDFIQNLIVEDMKAQAESRAAFRAAHPSTPTATSNPPGITDSKSVDTKVAAPLEQIQSALADVSAKADKAYAKGQPAKIEKK